MSDATIGDVQKFFNMTAAELMKEWKKLNEEEKAFFKREVGKVINE